MRRNRFIPIFILKILRLRKIVRVKPGITLQKQQNPHRILLRNPSGANFAVTKFGFIKFAVVMFLFLSPIFAFSEEKFIYDAKGKRDPFVPLVTGKTKLTAGLQGVELPSDINLEGIVEDKSGAFAILNGVIVREGEDFGNLKIKKITKTNITVILNDLEYEITLKKEGEEKN